jgi:hypothetical protein
MPKEERVLITNKDSINYIQVKKEMDSLSNVLYSIKEIIKYSDSIRIKSDTLKNIENVLKQLQQDIEIEHQKITKFDTAIVFRNLRVLSQNEDSIKVLVLLETSKFNKALSLAQPRDIFCEGAQNFIQNFIPELYLFYYKYGKNQNLPSNKQKTKELFEATHKGSKNIDFYKNIVDKTFLDASSMEEFYKYLDVLMSIDISKCD